MIDKLRHIISLTSTQKSCFYSSRDLSDARSLKIGSNIFAGKYMFRGRLADVLVKELEDVKQVNKLMSRYLSKKNIERIYDLLQFDRYINNKKIIERSNEKYLTVYAFFGYIARREDEYTEILLDWAISNITGQKNYSYFKSMYDIWIKIKYLTKNNFNFDALVSTIKYEDNYKTTVWIKEDKFFESIANSFKTSRRNAFKKSMKYLLELEKIKLADYEKERNLTQKKLKVEIKGKIKKENYQKHLEYIKKREEERLLRKKKFREKEEIKKKYRNKSKRRKAKNKKLAKINQELFEQMLKNISSSKRRILEDRGILPKKR